MSMDPVPVETAGSQAPETDRPPTRRPEVRAFFLAHVALFIAFNTSLSVINFVFSPGYIWFPYVIWGWAMALVLHGVWTYPFRWMFQAHILLYALLNLGLVIINIRTGGPPWVVWPIASLAILLLAHWMIAARSLSWFRIHLMTTALCTAVILMIPVVGSADDFVGMVIPGLELWGLVAVHWLLRFQKWPPFRVHLTVYTGLMALFAIDNALEDAGEWWVLYPVVLWGALVATHGAATVFRNPETGQSLEASIIDEVRDISSERWPQRMFVYNAVLFLVMSVAFAVMEVIDGSERLWAPWPLGAWLVLLAMHAGWVLFPTRFFGVHLFAWIAGSVGMFAIDSGTHGGPWWYWPAMWWGVVVAFHAGVSLPAGVRLLGIHTFVGMALSIAFILTNRINGPPTWWWYPVGLVVVTLLLHLGLQFTQSVYARVPRREP